MYRVHTRNIVKRSSERHERRKIAKKARDALNLLKIDQTSKNEKSSVASSYFDADSDTNSDSELFIPFPCV